MEDLLLNRSALRYRGKKVGTYGPTVHLDDKLLIWRQKRFESYGGGFSMSEGLVEKLEDEGIGYVYITDADCLALIGEIKNSQCIDPWDKVFDDAEQRPREPQYLVKPDDL